MEELGNDKDNNLKIPEDIPEGFFDIVSRVLNFVEDIDQIKNK